MRSIILLFAIVGLTIAQRQSSRDVIDKFKEVAPKYLDLLQTEETQLEKIRSDTTALVAQFHVDVIQIKESYVLDAINNETGFHYQITNQPASVDQTCLGFLNTSLDMSINLAGVGFTNCINNVDDAFNELISKYFADLGVQEVLLQELRLLDVFRGDNVFYTPQNIIDKLEKKLSELTFDPDTFAANLDQVKETLKSDLASILLTYGGCMTQAQQLLKSGVDLLTLQLTFSCLGTVVA